MSYDTDAALLLLRLAVGGFQLPHGLQKFGLLGGDPAGIADNFAGYGLRPPLAWVRAIGAAQLLCGVLVTLGLATNGAALLTICLSLGMANVALKPNGWFWNRHGVEYALFWAVAAACVVLLGPGAWSVDARLAGGMAAL